MTADDRALGRAALGRGVDRVVAMAGPDGWHGFRTLAGESSVWVSAFVAARVGPVAPRRAALRRARAAVAAAQHPSGGWSFGGPVPPDADSTAWALCALDGTRLPGPERRRAAGAFLAGQRVGDGYATYAPGAGIAEFIGSPGRATSGWTAEHPDVTAAVLAAGPPGVPDAELTGLLAALVERQDGAGWWPAYWWRTPLYTTAVTVRALHRRGWSLPAANASRLRNALVREQLAGGGYALGGATEPDPFVTALALETLTYLGDAVAELRDRTARTLVAAQLGDGGWLGDFPLRIPPPEVDDPALVRRWTRGGGGGASYVLDRDGLFATAQACAALDRWVAVLATPQPTRIPLPPRGRDEQPDLVEVFGSAPS